MTKEDRGSEYESRCQSQLTSRSGLTLPSLTELDRSEDTSDDDHERAECHSDEEHPPSPHELSLVHPSLTVALERLGIEVVDLAGIGVGVGGSGLDASLI